MPDEDKKHNEEEAPDFTRIIVGLVIAVVVLGGIVYASYTLTQKKPAGLTFPSGLKQPQAETPGAQQGTTVASVNCTINQPNPQNVWAYYLKCDRLKTTSTSTWKDYSNKDFTDPFSFSVPADFSTVEFGNGIGIDYKEIGAANNLLYSIDLASSRSGEFKEMKGETYVKNYWRQYSGLTALKSYSAFSNQFNVKGYKAQYTNFANESPNEDIFFEFPSLAGSYVHFASGIIDQPVYDKIIDSFKWETKKK